MALVSKKPRGGSDEGKAVCPLPFCFFGCCAAWKGSGPICGLPGGRPGARTALSGSTKPPGEGGRPYVSPAPPFTDKAQRQESVVQGHTANVEPPRFTPPSRPNPNASTSGVPLPATPASMSMTACFLFGGKSVRQERNKTSGKRGRLGNTLLSRLGEMRPLRAAASSVVRGGCSTLSAEGGRRRPPGGSAEARSPRPRPHTATWNSRRLGSPPPRR